MFCGIDRADSWSIEVLISIPCRCGSILPRLADIGEKPGAWHRRLVEKSIAAVAVEAKRRRRDKDLRRRSRLSQRLGKMLRSDDAAISDAGLAGLRPAT